MEVTVDGRHLYTIPDEELERDRLDSLDDIKWCTIALNSGLHTYGNGHSVEARLNANRHFIEIIEAEQRRRKEKK